MAALRNLRPIVRSRTWLKGPQEFKYKVSYFLHILISYLLYVSLIKTSNHVNYLGNKFIYDSRVTPLGLMLYPEEVGRIIRNMDKRRQSLSILDIGANIGQFAVTFNSLSPGSTIDSFEPSPIIYKYLSANTDYTKKIRTFCLGVGEPGKKILHYSPKRSVNASLLARNSTYRTKDQKREKIEVEVINDIPKITGKKNYDLIKIDVEGYEYHTIKNLGGLKAKYLYIEITGQGRRKDYLHSELFNQIRDKFGNFDILYTTRESRSKFEMLLKFKKS